MIGLENISASNGWEMAVVGWCIVLSGLAVLSFTISQLHKILGLWDNRKDLFTKAKSPSPIEAQPSQSKIVISEDIQKTMRQLKLLTNRLGDPFSLPKLIDLSEQRGMAKPHSTINTLLTAKIIVPDGKGYFTWFY